MSIKIRIFPICYKLIILCYQEITLGRKYSSILKSFFSIAGIIEDIDIKAPGSTRIQLPANAAFAFIRYENMDMACRAKHEAVRSGLRGAVGPIKVGYGRPKDSPLAWIAPVCEAAIDTIMQEVARIAPVVKLVWPVRMSWALVVLESPEAAAALVHQLRGFPIGMRAPPGVLPHDVLLRTDLVEATLLEKDHGDTRVYWPPQTPHLQPPAAGAMHPPPPEERSVPQQQPQQHAAPSSAAAEPSVEAAPARAAEPNLLSLQHVAQQLPPVWRGAFIFKGKLLLVRLAHLYGDQSLADDFLRADVFRECRMQLLGPGGARVGAGVPQWLALPRELSAFAITQRLAVEMRERFAETLARIHTLVQQGHASVMLALADQLTSFPSLLGDPHVHMLLCPLFYLSLYLRAHRASAAVIQFNLPAAPSLATCATASLPNTNRMYSYMYLVQCNVHYEILVH